MPNNLDLLMAALDEGGEGAQAQGQADTTVTTVINIDNSNTTSTAKSNPKVAGVKRKASSSNSSHTTQSSNTLPSSLASILSTSSSENTSLSQDNGNIPLPPPILAEDSGIIRCICIFDDDDGFSIQCEKCFAWQHGLCVNVTPDAVPESYICPLCAASATATSTGTASPRKRASRASTLNTSNSLPQYAGTVGVTKADRDRATQLQRLRKEAEANLRRQRIKLGLPLSSADAVFGENTRYPPPLDPYAAEQALQDEELELLAQARGLAYQQSQRLELPRAGLDLPELPPANRSSKSHSPAVPLPLSNNNNNAQQAVLQPPAHIHPHRQDSKSDITAGMAELPTLPAPPANKKRRSANNAAAALKQQQQQQQQQQNEENKATPFFQDGGGVKTGKESQTPTQPHPHPRKRRSGAVPGSAQSSSLLSTFMKEDESAGAVGAPGNIAQSAAVAGLSASVTSTASSSTVTGERTKETVRPSRSRLMSSISASGANQATSSSANYPLQNSTSTLNDAALNPISQAGNTLPLRDTSRVSSEDEHRHDHLDDEDDEDDTDIDERYEPWQFEYTPISKLRYSSRELQAKIQGLVRRAVEEERENLVPSTSNTESTSAVQGKEKENADVELGKEKETAFAVPSLPTSAKPTRPGFLTGSSSFLGSHLSLSSSTRNGSPGPSSGSSTPIYSSTGVASSLSCPIQPAFLTSSTPLSAIANDLPRLSVKPLATSSLSLAPPACTPFSGPTSIVPSLMNPYPRPTIHGVFTTCSYPSGSLISMMNGQVCDGKEYRADPINQWNELGVLKNHTRGIGLPWDIVLDQRKWGDETRFLRQGCHPNVFVRPLVVRKNKEGGESSTSSSRKNSKDAVGKKNTNTTSTTTTASRKAINAMLQGGSITEGNADEWELSFGLYALQDISKREELVLPFDWSDDHVLHALHTLLFEPSLVFPPEIPAQIHRSSSGVGLGNGNGTDTSDDNDNDPDAHEGVGRSRSNHNLNASSSSSYTSLSQPQRQAISSATAHLYRLSKLANMTCLTLLGTTICACEKRRDCAVAWLWKLASFSEVNPKTRNHTNLLFSSSSSTNAALMDFDLKGLKIACSTALATEEKQGGAYNGTTRGSKKMGRKRRADLGALVGLVRGWNAFQRFNKREEADEEQEQEGVPEEQEEEDWDAVVDPEREDDAEDRREEEEEDSEMHVDSDPSRHALKRDHPTMSLPPQPTMSDVPEEVDMLMPTPTSNNSRSRQRNEFDFTNSNIPPILQSIMHNHDPQIAHKLKNADTPTTGLEDEENRDRDSDSDLTEPLPSDGEEGMRIDVADEEVVRPPKRRKSQDQGKLDRSVPEEQAGNKKAKSGGKKVSKGKNRQAVESAEEASTDKRRKKSKQNVSGEPSTSTAEVKLPKIIKKVLKARKEQAESADKPAATAAIDAIPETVSAGPSLDSLFDMKLPTSPPTTTGVQPSDNQAKPDSTAPTSPNVPKESATAFETGPRSAADQRNERASTGTSNALPNPSSTIAKEATQAEKPALSQVRKLSFRDYKQRVSTTQPTVPKASLTTAIPEEQPEQSVQSTSAKGSEATTPVLSPALSPDKMEIETPAMPKEAPETSSMVIEPPKMEEAQTVIASPPKAPSPPPAPRARLSFKAYRERLSAGGVSSILSPAVAAKSLDLEPVTPKPAVPETILEKSENITEEPASLLKVDEQSEKNSIPPASPFSAKELVEPVVKAALPEVKPEPTDARIIEKPAVKIKSPLKGQDSEEEGELVTDPVSEPGEVKSFHDTRNEPDSAHRAHPPSTTYSTWAARTPSPPPRSSTQNRARSPAPRPGTPPLDNRFASREQRYPPPASPPSKTPFGSPPSRPVQLQRSTGPLSPQAAPSSLQGGVAPPTGPRNPVAPPPPAWSGRGRGGSFTGRGRGFGASTYRPGPPPSAPRADREGQPPLQPPSAPRALRGGYQGPNTRGGYGGRGAPSSGPGRDAGWPSRGRRGRGNWQSDR